MLSSSPATSGQAQLSSAEGIASVKVMEIRMETEAAIDQAAGVSILAASASISGGESSAIGAVCM
jgi:hypothetical protein